MPPQTCCGDSQAAVRPEYLNLPRTLIADTTFVFVPIQRDLVIASHNKVRDILLLCELSEITRAPERCEGQQNKSAFMQKAERTQLHLILSPRSPV